MYTKINHMSCAEGVGAELIKEREQISMYKDMAFFFFKISNPKEEWAQDVDRWLTENTCKWLVNTQKDVRAQLQKEKGQQEHVTVP